MISGLGVNKYMSGLLARQSGQPRIDILLLHALAGNHCPATCLIVADTQRVPSTNSQQP
jgi:hypothetical protein